MDIFSARITLAISRATTDVKLTGYRNVNNTLEFVQWSTVRPFYEVYSKLR